MLVALAACTPVDNSGAMGAQRRDAILLWHNLPEAQAGAFADVIDRYRRANPGVDIVVQEQGPDMAAEFVRATRSGLGPNLLLTSSAAVQALAAASSILPLDERVADDDLARFLSVALRTLRLEETLYGLPMAVDTQVLYYNRRLVEQPPTTVDQLLEEASRGQRILMNSQFVDAVWSARPFGVDLFDAAGNPQPTTDGIPNWLIWVEQARDIPAFIMDDNTESLRRRFSEGDVPYYVGRAHELNLLEEALGPDLGVAQLPAGPAGSAGPALTTTAFMVNALSSQGQTERSLDLVRFITGNEQQSALMRDANLAPANGQVRISEGLYPRIAAITAQARTSIPFPNDPRVQDAYAALAAAYNRTLAGTASATEAAAAAQTTLIEELGFPSGQYTAGACTERGQLTVLALGAGEQLATLRTLASGFARVCPDINLAIRGTPTTGIDDFAGEDVALPTADLYFLSHQYLPRLLEAQAVSPVTDLIDPALVRQMRPIALEAMRAGDELYGAPVVADLQVFFQNQALAGDAAGTLADLRAQAQAGVPVLLDGSFAWGFWGVGAFGGRLFGDNGQFVLSPTVLTAWLAWLQESQQRFGIRTTPARSESRQLFVERRSAYFVGPSVDYDELKAEIGDGDLRVALMPLGPTGPGRPFAVFEGVMAAAALPEDQRALAARFLNYAASVPAQDELLRQLGLLPANSAVLIGAYSDVTRMAVQLQTATLFENEPWVATVFELGDIAYRQVLQEGVAPADAVRQMYEALSVEAGRYGITVPTPDPTPQPSATPTPAAPQPPVEETPAPQENGATPTPEAGGS
jgi:arabinogalactan oligomer / maltooligosaccharide transport system substrate-binding protein